MRVAVTSATGDQGAAIARAFAAAGWDTLGLTRDPARLAAVAATGATPAAVDDADPDALARALGGADVLVFTSIADYRDGVREALAERYAAAAARAGVRRAVINLAGSLIPGSGPNADALAAVEAAFASLPEWVSIEPTIYMDNLSADWMVAAITDGDTLTYAQPAHARASWISHATLADFAVAAATHAAAPGGRWRIGGPEALDGAALAARLGAALGRTLAYRAAPLDDFAARINANFGAPAGDRVIEGLRWAETHPDAMATGDTAARTLGVTPEPFAVWAARQDWPAKFARARAATAR